MRKLLSNILIFMMMIIAALPVMASETDTKEGHFMPLSQKFLEWQQGIDTEQEDTTETLLPKNTNSTGTIKLKTGYIPIPVDLSYLADNPPREPASAIKKTKEITIPSTYDLRNVNGKSYVTSMKNQLPFGTCWAFAAIGAMESNYLKNIGGTLDLSEQHLAWFAFRNPNKSKAFDNMSNAKYETVMENGGNAFYPTALYTRLAGPVNETDLPYETDMSTPTNITKEPEDYTRVLRLRDVFYLAHTESNVNSSTEARNNVKKRIMENGSVMASYFSHDGSYNKTSSGGTAYYHKSSSINHAIQIIGWDDNYSRNNFKSKPSSDGAWLIKNSWGTRYGDEGYFWMSYEQHLEDGTAFVVEQVDPSMLVYCYDDLGWCSNWGWNTSQVYSANVFQALRNGEKLSEIGFCVPNNNLDYEITIYTGLSSMPSSNPTAGGTRAATIKGTMSYAGYHTVALDNPITLTKGQYFAVVLKFDGTGMTAVERKVSNFSDNAVIENGSFFSYNGTSWETGQSNGVNACIKAFTTTGEGGIAPIILTSSLADGATGQSYSVEIAASGKRPLTWSLSSGKLPEGLSFSGGTISGTPTEAGDFTFTITATNSIGSDSQTYTLTINALPVIKTTSFTGYVGYELGKTETGGLLKLSQNVGATWKANSTLPKGLKLTTATGAITGKPSKAGTYTVSFTALISTGDNITSNVTFNINDKPTKPKIATSKLPEGALETEYTKTAITATGTSPITLTVSGLPDGLSFDGTAISGTPEKSGQFDVIITANNIATELEGKGGVAKKVKLTVKDQTPVIAPVSFDDAIVGVKYEDVQLELTSGTNVKWAASGLPKGMTLSEKGLLSGTPQGNAKTYNVTLKVTNTGGKDQKKVTLNVMAKPELTTKKLSAATDGKKYTGKIAAKGSTPMSWDITGLPEGLSYSLVKNGASIAFSGQPEGMGKYPLTITMTNSAGTITNTSLILEVKGVAPKITANVPKTGEANKSFTGNITVTGSTPLTITASENLKELGLVFSADESTGIATITGTPTKSVKSLPVTITAKNGASAKPVTKKISLTINGTAATFAASSTISNVTQAVKAGSQIQAIDFAVEGTPDFTFKMSHAEGFTLTQTGTYTARLTGTAPAKSGKKKITITAKNANGKAKKKIVIETTAIENQNAKPEVADEFTLPKAQDAQEAPEHEAQQEYAPAVTLGTDRTVESLGAGVRDMLEAEGYIIAAILPEVTVTESGMYDLDVTLQDGIRARGVLHWFAFPQNAEPSDDDEIAEFYDEDGAEIDSVPSEGDITVSAWLNENVTYAPVIAVKYE